MDTKLNEASTGSPDDNSDKECVVEHGPEMDAIFSDIQAIYDRGVPMFTKDQLRHMALQLGKYADGELEDDKLVLVDTRGEKVVLGRQHLEPDDPTKNLKYKEPGKIK
jgi:hypothetical protein